MTAILFAIDDGVARITLSSDGLNTLTTASLKSLRQRLKLVEADSSVRVLLLESEKPQVFSVGMDPKFALEQDQAGREALFVELMHLLQDYQNYSLPIVTDINGPALAGGAVLAMMGEFSVAHGDFAKLCFSETKVNLPVPEPIFKLFAKRVSQAYVNEVMLLGKNLDATALELTGMTTALYYDDEQRSAVLEQLLGRIKRIKPDVMRQTLITAKKQNDLQIDDFLAVANVEFFPFLTDEFLGAGLKAIMER